MTVNSSHAKRQHATDAFAREEIQLNNRNSGMPLEALRHALTPVGLHYLLIHFDIPFVERAEDWKLAVGGLVERPLSLSLAQLRELPQRTLRVTMECAGNGRALITPRWPSQPWELGAVGTAEWTGTSLRHVLERAGLKGNVAEIAFMGADRGLDGGVGCQEGGDGGLVLVAAKRAGGIDEKAAEFHARGVGGQDFELRLVE